MRHRARVCITALIVLLAAGVSASAAALSGKVVFWSMWSSSEPQAAVIQATVADFNAANPGVNVEVKFSGREIKKLIQPALQGGAQVDLWEQDPAVAIPNLKANVLRLDDMLTQPAVGMSGRTVKDSLLPSLLSLVRSYAKPSGLADGYYALPEQPYAVMFFYSKDLFDKAGIKTVPQTWDDFMAVCAALKKIGVFPVTFDDAYRDLFIGGYLASAMGSDWVDQLVKDKTGASWKSSVMLQFARDIQTMHDKGYFAGTIGGSKYPSGQQELVTGRVAMYLNGTWLPNEVSETAGPDFRWGAFQVPEVKNGNGKGGFAGLNYGAQGIMLNSTGKNIPAAFELARYLLGRKAQAAMSSQALAIPATVDTDWPAPLKEAALAFSKATVCMPWGFGIDNAGDFSDGTVIPVFMELVTGRLNAEAYTDKMAAEAKKYYQGK